MTVLQEYYLLFFKQNTAYELRISDWSSDVCSSDLDQAEREGDLEAERKEQEQQREQDGAGERLAHAPCLSPSTSSRPARGPRAARSWRSETRRDGNEGASTCRSRWSTYHY